MLRFFNFNFQVILDKLIAFSVGKVAIFGTFFSQKFLLAKIACFSLL